MPWPSAKEIDMKNKTALAIASTSLALLSLTGCGGGGDDVGKGVYLDKYGDSCDGDSWKTVTRTSGEQTIVMAVTVNTTGDVEPLKGEWSVGDGHSMSQSVVSAGASGDGTGRKFIQTVVVTSTGDLSYRLKIRDKDDDKRFETACKVHVVN
mgnify:CR=1 FL=1